MRLLAKFNVILLTIFSVGGLCIAVFSYRTLVGNARREVLAEAQLMMASASAVRDYTSTDLSPLLQQNPRHRVRFIAETVPAHGATATFARLQQRYPEYTYREAALEPTNVYDRANDWEVGVIQQLRNHPEMPQTSGELDTGTGRELFIAKPIRADQSCLQCHSTPSTAPPAMINVYGTTHGFGWRKDDVIGAQIISVPMALPVGEAHRAFREVLLSLVVALVITVACLDAGVYFFVILPLKKLSETADRISRGEKNVEPIRVVGKDEIAVVTTSFNRMQMSFAKAMAMLEE